MKKNIKFELADNDQVIELEEYIDRVLGAIDFAGSLVTDESDLADFWPSVFNEPEEIEIHLNDLREELIVKLLEYQKYKGIYCYDENGKCPYWDLREDKPYQRNGYCSFMEKGDWDFNATREYKSDQTGETQTADEIGLPFSLLWDSCKECGINNEIEEDEK